MKVGKLTLTPELRDGVWYVAVSGEDKQATARWYTHQRSLAEGHDAFGRYYRGKNHAEGTIRSFKWNEKQREELKKELLSEA